MPVAHVRKRVVPANTLIAGPEVDRRVTRRPGVRVEVAVVYVQPDTAQLVDELQEAVEVDGDEIVDRYAGERADRLHAAERAAGGIRGVDAVAPNRPPGAVDVNDQIAGKGQHRDRPRLRIRAEEHQRVRPADRPCVTGLCSAPLVGSDQECVGRLARQRHVEGFLRRLVRLRMRSDRREELVLLQVGRARDDQCGQQRPEEREPDQRPRAAGRRLRLAVPHHRRAYARRKDGPAAAVHRRTAADPSLQRRLHRARKRRGARAPGRQPRRGYRRTRLAHLEARPNQRREPGQPRQVVRRRAGLDPD